MDSSQLIVAREASKVRFQNGDMDFVLNWTIDVSQSVGMAPSQAFHALRDVKDGDPVGWGNGFRLHGEYNAARAASFAESGNSEVAGQFNLVALYGYRAALQYTDPLSTHFATVLERMERTFARGTELLGIPIRPIEVPFEHTTLAGYFLEHDHQERPTIVMVGGGDTARKNLFYFAGFPGWKRGYNVIMVDLPGQGAMLNGGLPFRAKMHDSVSAAVQWLETNAAVPTGELTIYGVSGGGWISAQAVAADPGIKAWVAATPIVDIAKMFLRDMGAVLRAPRWALTSYLRLSQRFNTASQINLNKYASPFGTENIVTGIGEIIDTVRPIDLTGGDLPSLFLVSEGRARKSSAKRWPWVTISPSAAFRFRWSSCQSPVALTRTVS